MEEHEQQREDVAAYALGKVDALDQARVEAHLRTCATCPQLLQEYQELRDMLPYALPQAVPPPQDREALLRRVRGDTSEGAVSAPTRLRRVGSLWTGGMRWGRWGIIAALLLGLLGWNVRVQLAHSARSAEIARLAGQVEGPAALLINTPAAPQASGRLFLSADRRQGVLAVGGLPTPPPGKTYQFWFARPDKSRDSAGVFSVGAQGEALLTVTVPGAPEQYNQVWITLEPDGGSAVPTPPHFLEGPL